MSAERERGELGPGRAGPRQQARRGRGQPGVGRERGDGGGPAGLGGVGRSRGGSGTAGSEGAVPRGAPPVGLWGRGLLVLLLLLPLPVPSVKWVHWRWASCRLGVTSALREASHRGTD